MQKEYKIIPNKGIIAIFYLQNICIKIKYAKISKRSKTLLNLPFFIAAFTSVFWLFFSIKQFHLSILAENTPEQIFQTVFILTFPLAIIWGIVALVKSNNTEKEFFRYIYLLADQIKKNTESTANLEKTLSNSALDLKSGVTIQEFNTLIADTNEILSDIIKRSNSISSAQLEHLWARTSGSERWLMAKTFIEISNYQTDFTKHLEKKANKDVLLKGSILEFVARYKTLLTLLETQDSKKIFFNIIQYGALGKVSEILAPLAVSLSSQKVTPPKETIVTKDISQQPQTESFSLTEEPMSFPSFLSQDTEAQAPAPQISTKENDIDAGLRAIREEILTSDNNKREPLAPNAPIISGFTQTQSALRELHTPINNNAEPFTETPRKAPVISLDELEEEINASPDNNYDEYAYPFGAWLNEKNNK